MLVTGKALQSHSSKGTDTTRTASEIVSLVLSHLPREMEIAYAICVDAKTFKVKPAPR